jgi:hypothetical protein
LSFQIRFDSKLAPGFGLVINDQIADDPGREVGNRREPGATLAELLAADHPPFADRVARRRQLSIIRCCAGTLAHGRIPVAVVL